MWCRTRPAAAGTARKYPRAAEPELWLELSRWIDENPFREAKEEGWLPALRYYASCDLRWEQLWSYWEECDAQWQQTRPTSYPALEEWRQMAESRVTALGGEPARRGVIEPLDVLEQILDAGEALLRGPIGDELSHARRRSASAPA